MMESTESGSGALGMGVLAVLLDVKLSMIRLELSCFCSNWLIVDDCCANCWFKSTIIRTISGCIFWVGCAENFQNPDLSHLVSLVGLKVNSVHF